MGYYFLGIGSVIAIFGLWATWRHLRLAFGGGAARGTVVAIDEKLRFAPGSEGIGRSRKRIYYHPVIEFRTAEGRRVTFTYGGGSTSEQRWAIGTSIEVCYDPSRPEDATVDSFMGLWAGPLAVAVLSIGALAAGIATIRSG